MLRKEKMFKLNFKKVFAFLFAFVLCFGCIDIYADDGGYTIDNYTVNATYNSDNTIDVKEVRLSPNIDTNDLNTKVGAARKFISKGDKVKVTLRFRGREMAHMHNSKYILDDFAEKLADIAVVEKAPKVEGRSMTMFLTEKR